MRIIFLALMVLCSGTITTAQVATRVSILGAILAPQGDDVEGINIRNSTTRKGVVTDKNGNFMIRVGLNDRLEINAIQFQKFAIQITKSIMAQKQLHVFVNESVNQLEEVLVTPYNLSGALSVDVNRIVIPKKPDLLPEIAATEINETLYTFNKDEQSALDNLALGGRRIMEELNLAHLFRTLWKNTYPSRRQIDVQ